MNADVLKQIAECVWEIPAHGSMRVPARLYASRRMIDRICADNAPAQLINVACLPGIVTAALAMPDMHWGYGFPIGGVAAFDVDTGVVSPGGVGYDINCGVRLMTADIDRTDAARHMQALLDALYNAVPSGVGASGNRTLAPRMLRDVAEKGAAWTVENGCGTQDDLDCIEEQGCLGGADADSISQKAWQRGADQVGTLGAGNHFLEVGYVEDVFDETAALAFGLAKDRLTVMIHCGSRGFGHQVCDDALGDMGRAAARYGIELPDRQLACAPVDSPEGQRYLGAMRAAVNYAFANRQMIAHLVRKAVARIFGDTEAGNLRTLYEVAHNIAKIETHRVNGQDRRLCVHRKGATRAFGPGHDDVPERYRHIGQPVLIPGDMGTCSYVLAGTEKAMQETFGSACHGAGRAMSRHQALKAARGRNLFKELAQNGVLLKARSKRTVGEEMPEAYKNVSDVVDACHRAGIATKVARLRPLACVKG
jgi:tRNA-splicing ligase RtcB